MNRHENTSSDPAIKAIAALALVLFGCAGQPQTADEFRRDMGKLQTFDANRSFRDIAKTFQAKARECLNVRVRSQTRMGGVTQMGTTMDMLSVYKSTVLVTDKKAELHVQRHYEITSGTMVGKEPPGGYYTLVVDATPLSNATTRVDIYGHSMSGDVLPRAITGWATGQNLGCPDMTKN
ncbi:MAG TPA: hypothetical protein VEM38_01235 [Burkholderiales bacterium]|nr:hypothetical protein [Burkholderiales bacterium]